MIEEHISIHLLPLPESCLHALGCRQGYSGEKVGEMLTSDGGTAGVLMWEVGRKSLCVYRTQGPGGK